MVMQRPGGIESVWLKPLRRIAMTALGAASVACTVGFPVFAHADEQTCAVAHPLALERTVDAEHLGRIRAGASVLDPSYAPHLAVILWDEARPPVPPVRNVGAHAHSVTASVNVNIK